MSCDPSSLHTGIIILSSGLIILLAGLFNLKTLGTLEKSEKLRERQEIRGSISKKLDFSV